MHPVSRILPVRLPNIYYQLIRCMNHTSDVSSDPLQDINSSYSDLEHDHIDQSPSRMIKVAILGTPNAGKSTLINKIIGHPVFSVSKKVHTTKRRARAAVVRGNTQVLFVDTPGLVSASEMKKFNLSKTFEDGGLQATREAHIVGVVHDVENTWTRRQIDGKILSILEKMDQKKKTFLVLNKVDTVKNKSMLLELIKNLTEENKAIEHREDAYKKKLRIWPYFSEVFLVSALQGNGVNDILDFLLKEAREQSWQLPPGKITDLDPNIVISELVRGRLLDALPQEVPYGLRIETEYMHQNELGEIVAVVLVMCPLLRHCKMLIAERGRTIRRVARLAEADARNALRQHVRLRVVIDVLDKKPKL